MRKGKSGVALALFAAAAMVFAMLELWVPLVAVTVFAIAYEKDEWTSKMCIQACAFLGIYKLYCLALELIDKLFFRINAFNYATITNTKVKSEKSYKAVNRAGKNIEKFDKFTTNWHYVFDAITFVIYVAFIVMLVIALIKVMKQKDAGLPFGTKFANWALGLVVAKTAAPVYAQPQQMAPQQMPQAQPQQMAAGAKKFCTGCGAEVTGPFCTKCGKQA